MQCTLCHFSRGHLGTRPLSRKNETRVTPNNDSGGTLKSEGGREGMIAQRHVVHTPTPSQANDTTRRSTRPKLAEMVSFPRLKLPSKCYISNLKRVECSSWQWRKTFICEPQTRTPSIGPPLPSSSNHPKPTSSFVQGP